ncbi:low molecular weight phosphatase family protein [Arthrobacter sp. NPDC090010]|uniref:arsenate reductase/protein-tyrosine-phosphatase family protein n=1 Tax=Arthrobacter sp. NPDC090010 TaxID=3363942 RepID=UPI003811D8D3
MASPVRQHRAVPSTVLTVCIGNICRSPLAEQLLRAQLEQSGLKDFEFFSAGLQAVVGAPMEPWPAALSREYGGVPDGAVGKQIIEEIVGASDLILTMTLKQREELLKRYPSAAQRTFTLAEFARIITALPEAEAASVPWGSTASSSGPASAVSPLVSMATQARHLGRLSSSDDVPDPIGKEESVHRQVGEQIRGLTNEIAKAFSLRLGDSDGRSNGGEAR